jgi:ATP-dependent DNA helicase RecQ
VRDLIVENERPAIVFCSSRAGVEKLARFLKEAVRLPDEKRLDVRFYHAGLLKEEKSVVEKWFFDSADGVLVATCAYGMGVDKANVRTVIHRDCPPSIEAYLQESGRAGRDGKQSRAFLVWGPSDSLAMRRAAGETDKRRLASLMAYARDTSTCRRHALLSLLGSPENDAAAELCCDVCQGEASGETREEGPLLSFFRREPRAWTLADAGPAYSARAATNGNVPALQPAEARKAICALLAEGRLAESRNWFFKKKLYVKTACL